MVIWTRDSLISPFLEGNECHLRACLMREGETYGSSFPATHPFPLLSFVGLVRIAR